ncbi:carbon-nitrogen hydrolase family protein [Pseudoalteromonas luteoviolacea]|uniref:carbon-nitrogen hydrolase family protein n=1 Tax=Pseudoalteromonas luteoviolacea TaxID=43657 RepID=UPI001B362EFE|nr:carbon-nitrogen hydrolase family protein [Pseudoalteromonas luteoviolacea]MBQ4810044.1 carbon-nitrogen hydrolase family protein [Pseudoalteromonas luteoviolacea]
MKIAVAQCSSIRGNVESNIDEHLRFIQEASNQGVHYLVFPELSLTGYEPELADELAFTEGDVRLEPLISAAKKYNLSIGVGAPLASKGLPKIGLILIHNTGAVEKYEKMFLHEGEELYFSHGDKHHLLQADKYTIANAICADTVNPEHAQSCFELGANVYIAGVLVTPTGYTKDAKLWSHYASEYEMLVAIANYSKPSGGLATAGKSAIWFKNNLIAQVEQCEDAIVIAQARGDSWVGKVHKM